MTMIFYRELTLDEGYAIADLPKGSRLVAGREVNIASGIELFKTMRGQPIMCWRCGCVADRWITCKGSGDKISKPVLNLFATFTPPPTKKQPNPIPRLVMMTRDHIIPKSLGGVDRVANLRPGCEFCNSQRGSQMTEADEKFMNAHPELIDPLRAAKGEATRKRLEAEAEERRKNQEHKATLGALSSKQNHAQGGFEPAFPRA